jgi:putative transposase
MKLNLPRRKRRHLPEREPQSLNVLDEGALECLGIEVATSLPALRVVRLLEQIKDWRGTPKSLQVDNGPELISATLQEWCEEKEVKLMPE